MIRLSATLFALVFAALPVAAQASPVFFSASAQVNPTQAGTAVVIDVAATQVVTLNTGCGLDAVRAGSPTGPVVFSPFICPRILLRVGPSLSNRPVQWSGLDQSGVAVAPGLYFVEIGFRDTAGLSGTTHVPVVIEDPLVPSTAVLSTADSAGLGATLNFSLTAPTRPGNTVFFGASFTTNVGQNFGPGVDLALDADFLFGLSFPSPSAAFFNGFLNVTDSLGSNISPISMTIPNDPALTYLPLAIQGVLFDPSQPAASQVVFSNPLTFIIG